MQALAVGLDDDRKRRELPGHLQQAATLEALQM
jgi:hypothetical protein